MKVLIFGGSGQLGQEFIPRAKDLSFEIVFPSVQELDITEAKQVKFLIEKSAPDIILNCAAYTAVDQAESDKKKCFAINRDGAKNIAKAARKHKSRVVHISTDYVFAGDSDEPLKETDQTNPKSVYGQSKLEGEKAVLDETDGAASIIRTSSLHGKHGNNFVHSMLSLFDQQKEVSVVADQVMSPCWAGFLAESLLDIIRVDFSGILHCSCSGAVSWFDFAKKIGELAFHADSQPKIVSTTLEEFKRPASRPKYSPFNLEKCAKVIGRTPMNWQDGLKFHLNDIERLLKNKKRGLQ